MSDSQELSDGSQGSKQAYYRLKSKLDHWKWMACKNSEDVKRVIRVREAPVAQNWTPLAIEPIEEDESDRKASMSDFPNFDPVVRCLSLRAADVLRDLLEPNGEFLAAEGPGGDYVLYHALHVCDAFDWEKSDIIGSRETRLSHIRTASLRFAGIDSDVFRIPESVVDIFVSEKFKSRVLEHSLTGFDLRPAIIA